MAVLTSAGRDALPDSAFAYIEPGGNKAGGKTTPASKRHYPIHDAAHVRNALARIAQGGRFGSEAKAKVLAAAKRFGIEHDESSTGRSFDSLYPEVRFLSDIPEIRSMGDGQPERIHGYAAAFGKLSRRLGGFVERVMPTAFDEARSGNWENVVCRFNHKEDYVLGTSAAGTLSLDIDERGLRYDVLPPKHRADVMELVERGDVRYSSFAFRCMIPGTDDEWGATDYGFPMRSLHNVALLDVAPVLDPAYRDTTAVARNMAGAIESLAMWTGAEPAEVRSMLEAGQAMRFFKRSDRNAPKPVPAEPEQELRVMDDEAVALRHWTYVSDDEEPEARAAEESEADERAMHSHDQMCKQYTHGEPCVLGAGHDGEHAQRCHIGQYAEHGLPCAKPAGHDGDHAPMAVDDDMPKRGPGRPRANRDGLESEETASAENRNTLSGPEALIAAMDMLGKLTKIDE